MRWLALTAILALLAVPLLPEGTRAGAIGGWLSGAGLELLTLRARLRARGQSKSLLPILVGGFFGRILLLIGGTVLGALTGLWSASAFLTACAAALLLGEGIAFARLR
jgi:hypothetical protein